MNKESIGFEVLTMDGIKYLTNTTKGVDFALVNIADRQMATQYPCIMEVFSIKSLLQAEFVVRSEQDLKTRMKHILSFVEEEIA